MSDLADRFVRRLLGLEGGFVDDPADSGGATRYGITEALARRSGYSGAMSALPLSTAISIYEAEFLEPLEVEEIAAYSRDLAWNVFEFAVVAGRHTAATSLQRCLNVLNRGGADYADIDVDGWIGTQTLSALRLYLYRRGPDGKRVLERMLEDREGAHFFDLAERREKDELFIFGWYLQRIVND